ncbi:MAG: hypothetical protein QW726_05680 [Fervidicoccaceae archaeon]
MSRSRRTVAVEKELVEELSRYARERGMSLANYIRSIFSSAIHAERVGFYPPNLVKEALGYEMLRRLGFILVPPSLLEGRSIDELDGFGSSVGRALLELTPEAKDIFESYALSLKIAFPKGNSILLPPLKGSAARLRALLIGMAKGLGFRVEEDGEIAIIYLDGSSR